MAQPNISDFPSIKTNQQLANYLGIELRVLTMLAYATRINKYKQFAILKKNGKGTRTISSPIPVLKRVQSILAQSFNAYYKPPTCVHGFVPGRSIVTNAKQHTRKSAIVEVDLANFFPSISAARVHGLLRKSPFSFSEEVINTITELVCNNGSLPQGSPSSPILSNMICYRMDKQLSSFANKNRILYSRYADDITFSSTSRHRINSIIDESSESKISKEIEAIITKNGFSINQSKSRILNNCTRQTVTGIIVNKKCNFPRSEYRELRVLFHNWLKYGIDYSAKRYLETHQSLSEIICDSQGNLIENKFIQHVRGRLDYYTMITAPNTKPSGPLIKLWTLYWQATHKQTPYISPECAIFKTECAYDYGVDRVFAVDGTGFKLDNGIAFTCRHCLCTGCLCKYPDDASVEISFNSRTIDLNLSEFVFSKHLDAASTKNPQLNILAGLQFNLSYQPQIGETITAIGFAEGKDSLRKIDAVVAEKIKPSQYRVNRAFIHGMSGGPVINSKNEVIGIVVEGSAPFDYAHDGEFIAISAVFQDGDIQSL